MIRINLNRTRRRRAPSLSTGKVRGIYVAMAAIVLEAAGFTVHYCWVSHSLRNLDGANRDREAKLAPLKNQPGELQRLQEGLKQVEGKIASLQALATKRGSEPVQRLSELSKILTAGVGPTLPEGKAPSFSPGWTPDNVWLSLYEETGPVIKIEGRAVDFGDVQEFNNRLEQSSLFTDLSPLKATREANEVTFADQLRPAER